MLKIKNTDNLIGVFYLYFRGNLLSFEKKKEKVSRQAETFSFSRRVLIASAKPLNDLTRSHGFI